MKDKSKLKTKKIQIMLTEEEYNKIITLAQKVDRTASNYTRSLVLYALNQLVKSE